MVLPHNQTNLRLLKLSHEIVSLFTGLSVREVGPRRLVRRRPLGNGVCQQWPEVANPLVP